MDIETMNAAQFASAQEQRKTDENSLPKKTTGWFRTGRTVHLALIILLLGAMLAQGISNIMGMSVTWDEAMYVGIGNYIFRTLHIDFRHIDGLHFHPVWSFYLNSVLLLFLKLPVSTLQIPADGLYTFTAGKALLFHSGYSPETILFLIRLPILIQTLFLGCLAYRFAVRLFGPNAGLLALALLAFDPNVLAHSSIACTDSSVTVWMFATVYAYYEYLRTPSTKLLLLTGACLGIACLSKVSAPIFLALILPGMYAAHRFAHVMTFIRNGQFGKSLSGLRLKLSLSAELKSIQHCLLIALTAAFMIWAAYGFGLSINYKTESEIKASGVSGAKAIMQSTNFIRLPLAPYGNVVAFVTAAAVNTPRHAYLFGQHSVNGFRTYALVNFLLKTPLPVLLLLLATLVLWKWLPRADVTAEVATALGFMVPMFFGIFEHANCGLRYILPIYPFLYLFISRLGSGAKWKFSSTLQRGVQIAVLMLAFWNAVESVIACPNQIAYFNTLFNNPNTKYHYLVDSNVDWGNELYALRDYMKEHQIDEISLQYFGNVDPRDYGINWRPATNNSVGWVAISATNLAGAYLDKDEFASFRALKPAAVLCGGGMFVFHR